MGIAVKRFKLAVAGGAHAPELARSWLRNATSWLPTEAESTLALLVSELVNNAVRHGGAGREDLIELELRKIEGGVGVSVTDPGPGFVPSEREAPLEEPGGWVSCSSIRWPSAGAWSTTAAPESGSSSRRPAARRAKRPASC